MSHCHFLFLWLFFAATIPGHALPGGNRPLENQGDLSKGDLDVLNYRLDIDLFHCYKPPYPVTFTAIEEVTIRVGSPLRYLLLNASSASLSIDSVTMAGMSFTHHADTLNIFLDRFYIPGEIVKIGIYYRHLTSREGGFFVSSGLVYTDSPPEGARQWLPCRDHPSDKATWELIARVPHNVRLGSNGRLADSIFSEDRLIYHWISDFPISTYLITITSGVNFLIRTLHWQKLSHPEDSIPVLIYCHPGEDLTVIDSTIIPMTNFFSEKFGDYPFEKIGFATLDSSFPWGGMENQTMVTLRPGAYSNAGLIAHEHSHQWFGDLITCGTWADIWLNEGFGTYCQNLWVEHSSGQEAYKVSMNTLADYYLSHNPGWPLYRQEWAVTTPGTNDLYNQAISYNKGACVLFQLRYVLGDSIFFRLMHDYATDSRLMFGNAVTQDFIDKARKVSGQDLDWFFNEWVYAPDHPVYRNTYTIDSTGENRWKLTFTACQLQADSMFYKMPLQLGISFFDGRYEIIRVMNDKNCQEFAFTFSVKPESLEFDPLRNILLKQAETSFRK